MIELRFMEETDGDPVTCDADREKYNDLVKKLKYIKLVKKKFKVI